MATARSGKHSEPQRERNVMRDKGRSRHLPTSVFTWRDIPTEGIAELVRWVTGAGEGIILGCTSDGGALSITILSGDDRVRQFPATIQAWDVFIAWVRDEYQDLQISDSTE